MLNNLLIVLPIFALILTGRVVLASTVFSIATISLYLAFAPT